MRLECPTDQGRIRIDASGTGSDWGLDVMDKMHSIDWEFPNRYREVYGQTNPLAHSLIRSFIRHFSEFAADIATYYQPDADPSEPTENRVLIVQLRNGAAYEYKDHPFSDYGELSKVA